MASPTTGRAALDEAIGPDAAPEVGGDSRNVLCSIRLAELGGVTWRSGCAKAVAACALTADAALSFEAGRSDGAWALVARNRADGEKRWTIALPSPPIHDGLAIARDGQIIVALRDGTVVGIGSESRQR